MEDDGEASAAGRGAAVSEVLATTAGWDGDEAESESGRGWCGGAGGVEGDFWGEAGAWLLSGGVGAGMGLEATERTLGDGGNDEEKKKKYRPK